MPRTSPYRADERLDDWVPDPAVRTHHRRSAAAAPEELWDAARAVRLSDTRRLERLVRWRIPGVVHGQTYDELFRTEPFTLLDEGDTWSVSGLVRAHLDARSATTRASAGRTTSATWDERGTVRVLFAHWAEPGDGRPLDAGVRGAGGSGGRTARLRLKALWTVIGPFERLVGAEPLDRRGAAAPSAPRASARGRRAWIRRDHQTRRCRAGRSRGGGRRGTAASAARPGARPGTGTGRTRRRARRLALELDRPARRARADPPRRVADGAHDARERRREPQHAVLHPHHHRRSARRASTRPPAKATHASAPANACACPHHQCSVKRGPQFFSA